MKKIYLVLIVLIGISVSCTKNFEEFNTSTTRATVVPAGFLFANAQKALADQISSTNVNLNNYKLFAQYWTEVTYVDEANYDIVTRNVSSFVFRAYYRDILADLKQATAILNEEAAVGDEEIAVKQNQIAIINLLEAYCYQRLVDQFGNVPYSEALDVDNISPAYDDGFEIYKSLITNVTDAIGKLNTSYGSFGTDDLYMGGDVAMWIKFGHTLKVKLGITLADYDPALSKSTVESAYAGIFDMGEKCDLEYLGGSNSNPLYQDLVQSGRHDFVPANTIVDIMNELEDPRRPAYFEINGETYRGAVYGEGTSFSQNSHIADPIQEPTYAMILLDHTEAAFYLAEAAERGYSVGGSAEEWYNNAITASFAQWGLETEAAAYLAKPEVAYGTAAGDWKQVIGTQAWLAFYVRGFVGWTSYRRLDAPTLNLPPFPEPTVGGMIPKRMTFPINEQTLNAANYAAAAAAIGGDEMKTPIFWDN
ncbi:MAG: SusD/RagB family nutrient-binding outer membrane lipoprotein [Bacteroidetes bacterium]|nr:SusD/RagB family nutrient-binding outer membrane lipoprotein [Bacteroidota bacterium]